MLICTFFTAVSGFRFIINRKFSKVDPTRIGAFLKNVVFKVIFPMLKIFLIYRLILDTVVSASGHLKKVKLNRIDYNITKFRNRYVFKTDLTRFLKSSLMDSRLRGNDMLGRAGMTI
jgi:hypothetical protein